MNNLTPQPIVFTDDLRDQLDEQLQRIGCSDLVAINLNGYLAFADPEVWYASEHAIENLSLLRTGMIDDDSEECDWRQVYKALGEPSFAEINRQLDLIHDSIGETGHWEQEEDDFLVLHREDGQHPVTAVPGLYAREYFETNYWS